MSYTKAVDFAAKDALITGNPAKVVKGTEIGAEFDAIQTADALNLKRDGTATASANIPMGGYKHTGLGAGTTAGDSVRYEQFASPPAIGSTTASTVRGTTVTATTQFTGPGTGLTGTAASLSIGGNAATATTITTAATETVAGKVELATTAEATAGTDTTRAVTPAGVKAAIDSISPGMTLMTEQATTSGTSKDFTGIPSGVNRVTVLFNGVSTSGAANYYIQIGSGSVQATGYLSQASVGSSTTGSVTTAFVVATNINSGSTHSGRIVLNRISGNTWVLSGIIGNDSASAVGSIAIGRVDLSGAIDRVRVTTSNGTDTFDAGSVNVMYE